MSKDWPFSKESVGGRAIALEDFDFLQIDHKSRTLRKELKAAAFKLHLRRRSLEAGRTTASGASSFFETLSPPLRREDVPKRETPTVCSSAKSS